MANTKTTKITEKSVVRVYNNTTGSASFIDFHGKKHRFPRPKTFVDVEMTVLLNLYNECPKFIEEGHVTFEDVRVYEFLGITEDIYSKIIPLDDINDFLNKSPEEIKEELANMPKQMQENVAVKAKEMGLDSNKKIKAIKDATGLDVSEDEDE